MDTPAMDVDAIFLNRVQNAMVAAARQAGDILMAYYRQDGLAIEFKGTIDLVSEADRSAEDSIKTTLAAQYPTFGLLCEESGASGDFLDWRFIVDPLDGTTSFIHRHPHFSVSIACERRGHGLQVGVVYNPTRDEMFVAQRGRGATCNGKPIRVSSTALLINSLISTGFPTTRATETNPLKTNFPFFEKMMMQSRDVRRNGSAALDLCYVACGRHDLFWEQGLKAWDVSAGHLILIEAGGRFSDLRGGPVSYESAVADERFNILGSNGLVHEATLAVFQNVRNATRLTE